MHHIFRTLFFTGFLVSFLQVNTYPQFSASIKFENYFDDNIYNTSLKTSDFINSLSYAAEFNAAGESNNLQLYYLGNYSYFQKNNFKSSSTSRIGIVNTHLIFEEDNPLNIGLYYNWRNNRDDYSIFDMNQLSAYANYRQALSESSYGLLGYFFNKNSYENLPVFSYYEQKIFLKAGISFESKTSLHAGIEYARKSYLEASSDPNLGETSGQLKGLLNIGQSVSENTGLSFYILLRKNLSSSTRILSIDEYAFYEEEVFNDVYSNEGYEISSSITHFISEQYMLKLEFIFSARNFIDLPVYSSDGTAQDRFRQDKNSALGVSLQADLTDLFEGLTGIASWNYFNNSSNDPFYTYDNTLYSITFEIGF